MSFSIVKYLENNKIELGSIKKEVGTNISKSGHNDLRKTNYDVNIKDGKLDLYTHKTVLTESNLNEERQVIVWDVIDKDLSRLKVSLGQLSKDTTDPKWQKALRSALNGIRNVEDSLANYDQKLGVITLK